MDELTSTCGLEATIAEAARRMVEAGGGAVSVVNAQGNTVGVLTERDIVRKGVAAGKHPETPVRDILGRTSDGGGPNPEVDDDEGACCGMLPGRRGP